VSGRHHATLRDGSEHGIARRVGGDGSAASPSP
jgi:hypothetical protein